MSTTRKPLIYDGIYRHLAGHSVTCTGKVSIGADYKFEIKFLTGPGIHGEPIWVQKHEIKLEGE